MGGERNIAASNTNDNSSQENQFSLQVANGNATAVSYRFVPFKVEDTLDDDEIPLDEMVNSCTSNPVRLTLVSPPDNQQVFVVENTSTTITRGSRASTTAIHAQPSAREERRRMTHNEVERKRRDKINNWICKLAKILPNTVDVQCKSAQSKGAILSKACDYIEELRRSNEESSRKLQYMTGDHRNMNGDQLQEIEILKKENAALRNENAALQEKLKQNGCLNQLTS